MLPGSDDWHSGSLRGESVCTLTNDWRSGLPAAPDSYTLWEEEEEEVVRS